MMSAQPTCSRQQVWGGKDREGNNVDNDLNERLHHPVELASLGCLLGWRFSPG